MLLLNKVRVVALGTVCLIAMGQYSHAQAPQQSCTPADKIEFNRKKLLEIASNYQNQVKQKLDISAARLELLQTIQRCQNNSSSSGDFLDALSLQEPECNEEICQYNSLLSQEQAISSVIDSERILGQIYMNSVKQAEGNACQRSPLCQ